MTMRILLFLFSLLVSLAHADEFLDPATFRADSLLGVAGLMNAVRRGNVISIRDRVGRLLKLP